MRSVCIALLRWGGWPGWTPLLMRTLELNPSIRFIILGDMRPLLHRWPNNAKFQRCSVLEVLQRVRSVLSVSPRELAVSGGASKISDFKPMLGELFPELFTGCDWWGYMQEDEFLGDLRSFLDESLLDAYDTISPLPEPLFHAGPFMLYRNAPHVNSLFHRSSEWRMVVSDPRYLVFDEWWGELREHMSEVVRREAAAGRLRAYTSRPTSDGKLWLNDDMIYAESLSAEGQNSDAQTTPVYKGSWWNSSEQRWYHDSLIVSWRNGRLWKGPGSHVTELWDGNQGQLAVLHIMGSKARRAFRELADSEHLRRIAAQAHEFHVTRHGLWIKGSGEGRMHTWYSGRFPGVHMLVRSTDLARMTQSLAALGQPSHASALLKASEAVLPCVANARHDQLMALPPDSCEECERVQAATAAALARASQPACGASAQPQGQEELGGASVQLPHFYCLPKPAAASEEPRRREWATHRNRTTAAASCAPQLRGSPTTSNSECAALLSKTLREQLRVKLPEEGRHLTEPSLLPSWAFVYGLTPCMALKSKAHAAAGAMLPTGGRALFKTPASGHRREGVLVLAPGNGRPRRKSTVG